MDANEFRVKGKELIDYVADYLENINEKKVTPDVEPGFLRELVARSPPAKAEKWDEIIQDFESKIMPGITHWQHHRFHAYFPAGNSYPSILGDLLSSGLGIVGFSWAASPSCTELETICLDWLGKMLDLPKVFLPFNYENAKKDYEPVFNDFNSLNEAISEEDELEDDQKPGYTGGGVLLGSASECVLVSLLSARAEILRKLRAKHPFVEDGIFLSKLVMYTSKLAHSCVEKAAMIAMIKIRLLDPDENYALRGSTVEKAIKEDRSNGFIPFYVACTFGTTSVCSFDHVDEIGPVCIREEIYLHVDGAYAGSAMICEELRSNFKGLQFADSFNFNPNKWMLMNFDCSCLWVKDKFQLTKALSVDPIYLRYKEMDKAIDYRHWGISLSRRFRSLKIWFTIRSYGVEGLQKYIREGSNTLSQDLLFNLNDSGKIHMVPAMLNDKYVIRFCVNSQNANDDDMLAAWLLIKSHADVVLKQHGVEDESQNLEQISSKMKRLRFGVSKMVSEPRILNPKKYRRAQTTHRLLSGSESPRKYLARKCSIVESNEIDEI